MTEEQVPTTNADLTDDDKLWALLGWIFAPLIPIIVLLLEDKKNRPFIKYNAIQALVVGAVSWIISSILAPFLIGCFIGPVILIYQIYLGIQSYGGNWIEVPFVTDFCKKQGWI